ncbi:transmembrane protein 56-B [Panicum miliaceum]|uniref:Transmembrane protein 56-B n=1 Tax=Panicum miliaceum TaxID=4540 RepID=A0A3L6SXK4_PANMI|nr:transmembrane protein 56-B [Panicum miliaceum]
MDVGFGPDERILWPASVLAGVAMYTTDLTRQVSSRCFKGYSGLNDMHKVEWNNRGFSTFHALAAAAVSSYLLVMSGLFSEDAHSAIVIDRKSWLSDAMFGVSLGYFLADLAMILWYFPRLGGKEYGHVYILMVLFTEAITPFVNLRWYLDLAGRKGSKLYLYNGLALFVGWLVARIILFVYFFTHMYIHFDQVRSVFPLGFYSILTVPPALSLMNLLWFCKICKGMVKTLCKAKQSASAKTD